MLVSLATFYRDAHPGAALQAYALSRALGQLGHTTEFLNYERLLRMESRSLKSCVVALATYARRTQKEYASFRKRFFRESECVYGTVDEIRKSPPRADAYVCGSDQIWNPELLRERQFDPVYFLKFGPQSIPKVSYAASFGGYCPTGPAVDLLREYLADFSAISVREPESQYLLARIAGRQVAVTLDPTLLLQDYTELIDVPGEKPGYILLYSLQSSAEINALAREVSRYHGLPIWSVDGPILPWKVLGRQVATRNPKQWINLIHGASAIVTNSFHGLAFSIIFHKQVFVSPLVGAVSVRNARLMHLCRILGLESRVFTAPSLPSGCGEINWDAVETRFKELRAHSLQFIREALRGSN